MHEPFVGRQSELRSLLKSLAESRRQTAVRTVTGRFGMGKTRLLKALRDKAREQGHTTLELRCIAAEGSISFSLVQRLVAEIRGVATDGADEPQTQDVHAGRVFAAVEAVDEQQRVNVATAVLREAVVCTAQKSPLVITVDDSHLADASSLTTLGCLTRWAPELKLLIVVAMTTGEPVRAPAELEDLCEKSARIALGPFTRAETAHVAQQVLGTTHSATIDEVYRATAGKPLFVRSILHRLAARGHDAADITGTSAAVIGRCVFERLQKVSDEAARLAVWAAVLGPGAATLPTVAHLAGMSLKDARCAANALISMGVLHNSELLELCPPVSGSGIVGQLSAVEHNAARLEAAEYLHGAGASAEVIARQLIETDTEAPFPWAVGVLREVGLTARQRGDYSTAIGYLRRAAGGAKGPEREILKTELADLLLLVDLPRGIDGLVNALAKDNDPKRSWDLICRLGYALHLCDSHVGGRQVLTDLARPLTAPPNEQALWADLNLLYDEAFRTPGGSLCKRTDRLLTLLPEGRSRVRSAATMLRALTDYCIGRPAATAVEVARQASADPVLRELPTPLPLVSALLVLVYYGAGEEAYEAAYGLARTARCEGQPLQDAAFRLVCGLAANLLGDYITSEQMLREALCTLDDHKVWRGQPQRLAVVAGLLDSLISKGNLASARKLLHDNGLVGELPTRLDGLSLLLQRARLKSASGDLHGSLADLRDCGTRAAALGGIRQEVVPWRSHIAVTLHHLGRQPEAIHLVERDVAEARRDPSPLGLGTVLLTAGVVTGGEQGISLLDEASVQLESCGAKALLARARCEIGRLLGNEGRYEDAREALERAQRLAKDCGAVPVAELARHRLTAASPHRPTVAGVGLLALTAQERRVLSAALRGDSNTRIAEIMHVTRRTVELHLSSAYRKLGICGRKEFAKLFASQELWAVLSDA
ncbi:BREX system ATP-binding domain-containing protein [Streptomyces ossamyceticus]|uniref:BREX system ATP-binding domain-containing protein n=1 Tax=Streptomyces ossamyceticus TaxID=249581 RepID=UPI0036DFE2CF